jgi:hypothetical protein
MSKKWDECFELHQDYDDWKIVAKYLRAKTDVLLKKVQANRSRKEDNTSAINELCDTLYRLLTELWNIAADRKKYVIDEQQHHWGDNCTRRSK